MTSLMLVNGFAKVGSSLSIFLISSMMYNNQILLGNATIWEEFSIKISEKNMKLWISEDIEVGGLRIYSSVEESLRSGILGSND